MGPIGHMVMHPLAMSVQRGLMSAAAGSRTTTITRGEVSSASSPRRLRGPSA